MTLLEKIEAYVASQGNQVGGGSEFADLLKEIVNSIPQGGNEPLIVAGKTSSNNFTVTDGTSLQYILEEYKKGRLILLQDSEEFEVVIGYTYADGALNTKNWSLAIE